MRENPEQTLWLAFHAMGLWPIWFRALCAAVALAFVFILPKDPSRVIMSSRWVLIVGLGLATFSLFNSALLPFGDCLSYPAGVVWLGALVHRRWPEIAAIRRVEEAPVDRQVFEFLFSRRR